MLEKSKILTGRIVSKSFSRFLLVGVANTLVDAGVFNAVLLLAVLSSFEMELIAAKSLGFICASINSYYLNARWTFKVAGLLTKRKFLVFLSVSVVGLIINVSAAYVLFFIGTKALPVYPLLVANGALVGATAASLLWNYIGYKKIVFKYE